MEYRIALIADELFKGINVVLKDAAETVVGGIVGKVATAHTAFIKHLWIAEAHQHQRGGSHLLQAFEKIAQTQGCHQVDVETFDFQAPRFYEKHGYHLACKPLHSPLGYQIYRYTKHL